MTHSVPTALLQNTTGAANQAFGEFALEFNTTGSYNAAFGFGALRWGDSNGSYNVAFGSGALQYNSSGSDNIAVGPSSLQANTTGTWNTAVGPQTLYLNSVGTYNTDIGGNAGFNNTTGTWNTAVGLQALYLNTVGTNNTAIGGNAGYNITGSYNIDIFNLGASTDTGVIRIGTPGDQTSAFIAGISGVGVSGAAVIVNSSGQLGVVSSSRRYKQDIEPMGDASDRVFQLRPVRFRYLKPDENGNKPIQYGLIAEEVAEVFPELVIRNKDGQPETVAYHLLAGLLLNELQKEHSKIEAQEKQISQLESQVADLAKLKQQVAELTQLRTEIDELRHLTAAKLRCDGQNPSCRAGAIASAKEQDFSARQ